MSLYVCCVHRMYLVKSAFRLLAENEILKCPEASKRPIHWPEKSKWYLYILFCVVSIILPALGASSRVIEYPHQFCDHKWQNWKLKCAVVIYDDIVLILLTVVILLIFNTILHRTQQYFKDLTFLTDLIVDGEFCDGTRGSSNICKTCAPCCFANEDKKQYRLFLPLSTEQNQLAWYACRSYIKRKGVIILATLEIHILLLICVLFSFIVFLLFSVFYGIDFSGESGSNQTYYTNPALLGDSYVVSISIVFCLLMFFKGKRFEDINSVQLCRLQRQRSHLFKQKLSIKTLYNNNIYNNYIGTSLRNRSHLNGNKKLTEMEGMFDIETSENEAKNIVDSLQRIIDDCRNLDMYPLCMC